MAHHENNQHLSPEEEKFNELMARGNDFFKIEIFRSAKTWYTKALEMNVNNDSASQRLAECDRLLKYERKVFSVLGAVAAIILLVSFLIIR